MTPPARCRRPLVLVTLAILSAFGLVSCSAVETKDPEVIRKAAHLWILSREAIGDREYEIIEEVKGTSCATGSKVEFDLVETDLKKVPENPPSQWQAKQNLRVAAAELVADAVIDVSCKKRLFVWGCSASIVCKGDAIRWVSDGPPAALRPVRSNLQR